MREWRMTEHNAIAPGSGHRVGVTHRFQVRVYYEDTDAGGIVYHANYLNFAERARTEMLRQCGVEQGAMRRDEGLGFTVRRCEIDCCAPARLDDVLEVRTVLRDLRGARVNAVQSIHMVKNNMVDEDWLVRLDLILACVNVKGRATRLPERVRCAFAAVLKNE
jgi:acyl-CoA thioester hydrolase